MLPTATKMTERFTRFYRHYMRSFAHSSGVLEGVSNHVMHEGRGWDMHRPDGSRSSKELQLHSHEMVVSDDELATFDLQASIEKAREFALTMRSAAEKDLFQTLEHDLPESQKTDARGQPFDHNMFFQAIETIQIDFGDSDTPLSDLKFVVHPDMVPRLEKLNVEFEQSPELQEKLNKLMMRKKEEYREREALRQLVG